MPETKKPSASRNASGKSADTSPASEPEKQDQAPPAEPPAKSDAPELPTTIDGDEEVFAFVLEKPFGDHPSGSIVKTRSRKLAGDVVKVGRKPHPLQVSLWGRPLIDLDAGA